MPATVKTMLANRMMVEERSIAAEGQAAPAMKARRFPPVLVSRATSASRRARAVGWFLDTSWVTMLQRVGWRSGSPTRPKRKGHLYKDEAGVVRLGFGKHAGKAAAEVPSYLAWMLEEDFPERTKKQVRRIFTEQPLLV